MSAVFKKVTEDSVMTDIDLDFQLIATEMDTSVSDMLCMREKFCYGSETTIEQFHDLINDIKNVNGVEITSFDDNTAMYEYFDEAVIVNTVFGEDTLFFDSMVAELVRKRLAVFNK